MSYASPGPTNHLTNAYWNASTHQLLSGCTSLGEFEPGSAAAGGMPGAAAGGPNCTRVSVAAGHTSEWIDAGRHMDTLNHGTWNIPPAGVDLYVLEVGVATDEVMHSGGGGGSLPDAQVVKIAEFRTPHNQSLLLEVDASTRTTRRIDPRLAEFYRIVDALDAQTAELPSPRQPQPTDPPETWPGHAVPVFFSTFFTEEALAQLGYSPLPSSALPPTTPRYNHSLRHFLSMFPPRGWGCWSYCYNSSCYDGDNPYGIPAAGPIVGTGDGHTAAGMQAITDSLQLFVKNPSNDARNTTRYPNMVIQTGDEVSTYSTPAGNLSVTAPIFERWATAHSLTLEDVGCPRVSGNWTACFAEAPINTSTGSSDMSKAQTVASDNPELFFWYARFCADYGIATAKNVTTTIAKVVPNALVGSNFNPWDDFTQGTAQYVRSFREGAFSLP